VISHHFPVHFFSLIFFVSFYTHSCLASDTTPSIVYSHVLQLHKEVRLIKEHFNIDQTPAYKDIKTNLLPRHAWQRTYELFVKINILREKNGLPIIEPVNMEPTLELDPAFTYEQVQRLLQEVMILKFRFGIKQTISAPKTIKGKTATDVYNLLNQISRELDLINGAEFSPSNVFAESIRIYEDMEIILNHLNINEDTVPPIKKIGATAGDTYKIAIELLNTMKHLELQAGIKTVDFYAFNRTNVNPSDVFEITQITLAEMQVIKAFIGLRREITRGAQHYTDKTPADVSQLMGWLLKKAKLIRSLSKQKG